MPSVDRIPELRNCSFKSVSAWFSKMSACDLLFHPDDDPADMFVIKTGERMFSTSEVRRLRKMLMEMFARQGDKVYDAAYPVFMRRFHGSLPLIY